MRRLCLILAATTIALLPTPAAPAAPPIASVCGRGADYVDRGRFSYATTRAVAQPDGRTVLAEEHDTGDVELVRVLPDPTPGYHSAQPDPSFGSNGAVPLVRGAWARGAVGGLVLQPDGRLVAAVTWVQGAHSTVTLLRSLADGGADPSFGSGGTVVLDSGSAPKDEARDLVLQPDGRLVVVGARTAPGGPPRVLIARRLADGSPDNGFGTGGFVVSDGGYGGGGIAVYAVVMPDGKLAVANVAYAGAAVHRVIRRYTPSGALDPAFGSGGQIRDLTTGLALAAQPDGRLLVAGASGNRAVLNRLTATGGLDRFFGGAGTASLTFKWATAFRVVGVHLQNGLPVVTGSYPRVNDPQFSTSGDTAAVGRFTPDGRPDPSLDPYPGHDGDPGDGTRTVAYATTAVSSSATPTGCVLLVGMYAPTVDRYDGAFGGQLPGPPQPPLGGYITDNFGGLHRWGGQSLPPDPTISFYAPDRVRGLVALPGGTGGYALDLNGTLHPYRVGGNATPPEANTPSVWSGPAGDITRGVALLPGGTGGYVLDLSGALHPFAVGSNPLPPAPRTTWYLAGDHGRGLLVLPDGTGGYVLEANGKLHPFAVGDAPMPPDANTPDVFDGLDLARAATLLPGAGGGYVLDSAGALHRFAAGSNPLPPAASITWYRANSVRGLALLPGGTGGYVLDAAGRLNPFSVGTNPMPAYVYTPDVWPADLARGIVAF